MPPRTLLLLLIFLSISAHLSGQKPGAVNIIPNPGFEKFSDDPSGWYYSGNDFSRVSLYWTSPTASSPDLYCPKVEIPPSWKKVGFGDVKPYEGVSFAGITVFGCDQGKPHCREYIQVQLVEPLVPGQRYAFTCMLAHLEKSVVVKNIQLTFSENEIDIGTNELLRLKPILTLDRWIPADGKWYQWTGQFSAKESSSYLVIGNFNSDRDSQVKWPTRSGLRFGYYYVDDVKLIKIPPILPTPVSDSPLTTFIPEEGEIVTLGRIYFEHDRTDFMPRAMIQLKQLLAFINQHPKMKIEIIGHTDNVGTAEYNQKLSERRSDAVLKWLIAQGIDRDRLLSSGKGATEPVSTNDTSVGRSENRRVDIMVISL